MKIKMIKSPDRWVLCPICGNKTRTKIRPDTILENFPLFCPKCKQETLISAKDLNVAVIPQQIAESAGAVNGQEMCIRDSYYARMALCRPGGCSLGLGVRGNVPCRTVPPVPAPGLWSSRCLSRPVGQS